ncbi:hypothetical protein PG991_002647 [Apiospora marii]|uniref:Uncharacterized protein n=1 Tax=Apiospora marii TaxID=335849 RepID=A0ABR1SG48_9PEZI
MDFDRGAHVRIETRQGVEQALEDLLHLLELGQDLDRPVVDPRDALLGVVVDGPHRRRRGLEPVPRPEGLVHDARRFLLVRQRRHGGLDLVQRAPPSVQASFSSSSYRRRSWPRRIASAPAPAPAAVELSRTPEGERGRFHLVQEPLEPRLVRGIDDGGARPQQLAPPHGAQAHEEVPVDLVGHRLAADEQGLVVPHQAVLGRHPPGDEGQGVAQVRDLVEHLERAQVVGQQQPALDEVHGLVCVAGQWIDQPVVAVVVIFLLFWRVLGWWRRRRWYLVVVVDRLRVRVCGLVKPGHGKFLIGITGKLILFYFLPFFFLYGRYWDRRFYWGGLGGPFQLPHLH